MEHNIAIVGSEACGKTSFLAGLWLLCGPLGNADFTKLNPEDAESAQYLNGIGIPFSEGKKMIASVSTCKLSFDVIYKGCSVHTKTMDFAGEYFKELFFNGSKESQNEIADFLASGEYILLLLDGEKDLSDKADIERLGALLQVPETIRQRNKTINWKIGIVVTKADTLGLEQPDSTGIKDIIQQKLSAFYTKCQKLSGSKDVPCFALSSYGHQPDDHTPPEPRGYSEIFDWIFTEITREKNKKTLKKIGKIASIAIIVLAGLFFFYKIVNDYFSVTDPPKPWDIIVSDKRLEQELEKILKDSDKWSSDTLSIADIKQKETALDNIKNKSKKFNDRIQNALKKLDEIYDEAMYKEVLNTKDYDKYLTDPKCKRYKNDIAGLKKSEENKKINACKNNIYLMPTKSLDDVRNKINTVKRFEYFQEKEVRQIIEDAKQILDFLDQDEYTITVHYAYGLAERRGTEIRLTIDNNEIDCSEEINQSGTVTFNKSFTFNFSSRKPIVLQWWDLDGINELMAIQCFHNKYDLLKKLGRQKLTPVDNAFFSSAPCFLIEFNGEKIKLNNEKEIKKLHDWIETYLEPGTYWKPEDSNND